MNSRTAWERMEVIRNKERPTINDYIPLLFEEYFEMHGDRLYGDDAAITGGVASFHGTPAVSYTHLDVYKRQTKAGVVGMTLSAAKELGPRNITVNAVAPGFIETPMTAVLTETQREAALATVPLGRYGKPEEVAAAVAFLASDDAAYISGQVIVVDGAMSM